LEINKVRALSRSYAQAIAGISEYLFAFIHFVHLGQPIVMSFEPISFHFQLVFNINTDIQQPTIVYINEELNYPHGCDIQISPINALTWNLTNKNYYEFAPVQSTKNNTTITIFITPKTLRWFERVWNWIKMNISFSKI
jgi:hypothetical protein